MSRPTHMSDPPGGTRRPLIERGCVRFTFTGYGMQADSFAEPADCLYLDVGNRLEPGIIDQHHLSSFTGSTARLVLQHPELVDGAVTPQRAATDPFTMVLHRNPDLDGLASAYLAMTYLEQRAFPPHAEELVAYVDQVDQGYVGMSHAYPFALYSAYTYLVHRLMRRQWDTPEKLWTQSLQEGFAVLAFVLEAMQATAQEIIQLDAFACPGVFSQEDRQDIERDLARYRHKLHDPACHARVLTLNLPGQAGGHVPADTLLIRDVQNADDAKRCIFFKDWARTDRQASPHMQGFVALCVFASATPPVLPRGIISVRPDSGATLKGLGRMLDQQEAIARTRCFGVDDRAVDPQTRMVKPPRAGYDNSDPWYDGRGHNYTIVDAPRQGTMLSADEIEDVFRLFAKFETNG
jgi:hypothetical protein